MKKTVIIIFIAIAIIIGALVSIPFFFKQTLLDATKSTINKQVNADVNFDSFKLSLFSDFPKMVLEMQNVLIVGKGEFQKDTLFSVSSLKAKMNIKTLFNKSGRSIEEIYLIQPDLNLVVAESGKANWDLTKKSLAPLNTVSEEKAETENTFNLQLEKIEIQDANLFYIDHETNMLLKLEDININVNGKMYGTSTELNVDGKVDRFSTEYNGVKYISNSTLQTKSLLNVDYEKMDISILENELLVNRLPLEVVGTIKIPSDSMFFDLALKTKESGFENFLALVPPDFEEYLKDFETSGSAAISGTITGLFIGENYPAFSLGLNVSDGNFQYADLPEDIKNIKANISINKPQGVLDLTEVKIIDAHAEIRNNPVDLTLTLNNLISDPYFDGAFVGKINFDHVKDALPLDSVNISGLVDANLFVKGNYSAIENEQYNNISSDGIVLLNNFIYESANFTQPVYVPSGKLNFSPENINLSQFYMKVGQSDFNLIGNVSNYLNYIFKEGTLKGDLQLNSNNVNLNEMLRLQVQNKEVNNSTEAAEQSTENNSEVTEPEKLVFDIPENIDFTFRSNIQRASFNRLPISNINGLITARQGKLILNGLNMNMLDGELNVTGSYQNTPQNQPLIDFGFDIKTFDIPLAFQAMSGFQRMMPTAGQSQGKFSTNLKMTGQLTQDLKLIASSVDGNGLLNTENLQINNSPIFNQLKGILKEEKLRNVAIDNFKANFTVDNGNLQLRPFATKIAGQETNISGSLNAQSLLDMRLDFNIQREAFGSEIQNILSAIPGNENISIVPAGVVIKGPVGEPEVKMDFSETRKTVVDATKDDLKNSLKGLINLFK